MWINLDDFLIVTDYAKQEGKKRYVDKLTYKGEQVPLYRSQRTQADT